MVDLLVGSEDGCMKIVFGVLTSNGAFDGRGRNEEVCVDM